MVSKCCGENRLHYFNKVESAHRYLEFVDLVLSGISSALRSFHDIFSLPHVSTVQVMTVSIYVLVVLVHKLVMLHQW